jgi:O-antigen/teichoic acid export membrane protein
LIRLWTGDPQTAAQSRLLVPLLYAGAAIWSLGGVSNALQIAAGWPHFALYTNLFALVTIVPFSYFLTSRVGAVGAAGMWLLTSTLQLLVPPALLHRRVLKGERMRWYLVDLGLPVAVAAVVGAVSQAFEVMPHSRAVIASNLVLLWGIASAAVLAVCPELRRIAAQLAAQLYHRMRRVLVASADKDSNAKP